MLKAIDKTRKLSRFFLFLFTLCLTLLLWVPWISAKEQPKPKLQPWQVNGIVAALDDSYPLVQQLALEKLAKYKLQELKIVRNKLDALNEKVFNIFSKTVDSSVRLWAIDVLENLGGTAQPYVENIFDILKDKTIDFSVSSKASEILENMGDAAQPYVKSISDIIKDENVSFPVRIKMAEILGNLGDIAQPFIKDIAVIIKDKNRYSSVPIEEAQVLGKLGKAAYPYVKDIVNSLVDVLKDETAERLVRQDAVILLGYLGEAVHPYVKDIAGIVKNKTVNLYVRSNAVHALAALGMVTTPYVKDILDFLIEESLKYRHIKWKVSDEVGFYYLKTNAFKLQTRVIEAQGKLRKAAKPYIKYIFDILKDETVDSRVRRYAAYTLGAQGEAAQPYVKDMVDILKEKNYDLSVRCLIAKTLLNMGEASQPFVKDSFDFFKNAAFHSFLFDAGLETISTFAERLGEVGQPYIKDIADIVRDKTNSIDERVNATVVLGSLGEAAQPYVKDILDLLKDTPHATEKQTKLVEALGNIQQLNLDNVVLVLNALHNNRPEEARFFTHLLSGGTDEVKTLLKWLANASKETIPAQLTRNEGVKTLNLFLKVWKPQGLEQLQEDLARQISVIAAFSNVPWQLEDIGLLESHYRNLKQVNSTQADAVQSVLNNLKVWKWFFLVLNFILIHFAFLLLLRICRP